MKYLRINPTRNMHMTSGQKMKKKKAVLSVKGDLKKIEEYTMFIDWKFQYCQNIDSQQIVFYIQCTPTKAIKIFVAIGKRIVKHIYMERQKGKITKRKILEDLTPRYHYFLLKQKKKKFYSIPFCVQFLFYHQHETAMQWRKG